MKTIVCAHIPIQILFPVAYTGPKSWNTSIRLSRLPYTPSLRTEHDISWKELPRVRCLACALKALTAATTPSPQSRQRPRPKSAPPRLSIQNRKSRKSDFRPSTSSSTRKSLQPKSSKSPRISPITCKEGPSSALKSSTNKTSRVRSSYPKMSSPKSSTSVKKSLSFSPDTKEEETDSPPKPKGIRGGRRRRKAQLALMNGEELSKDDPRHAYYVLIHDDVKSGKPTASVKPIMSGENEKKSPERENESETTENTETVSRVVTDTVVTSEEVKVIKTITRVINDTEAADSSQNNVVNGVHNEDNGTNETSGEVKVITLTENKTDQNGVPDEKPTLVANNNTKSSTVTEEKEAERDWSKPKPIRGRRKKPKSDMKGNEPGKQEENQAKQDDDVINVEQKLPRQNLVLANGDI